MRRLSPPGPLRLLIAALCCCLFVSWSQGAEAALKRFDVPAGEARATIKQAAQQAGIEIVFSADVVAGVRTRPVAGELTVREAFDRLLSGTGLRAVWDEKTGGLSIAREARTAPGGASSSAESAGASRATGATGTIEGRVLDARHGEYLEKARVLLEGSPVETLTNAIGEFRLLGVPAGVARLRVSYTGLDPHQEIVSVGAGQTAVVEIALGIAPRSAAAVGDDTIRLDQFVVSSSREMDGAAIAINEQRFAANLVNVVSADEFGTIADGSVGEFMKFLPGIVSDYIGGDSRNFSINGVPSANVPVMIGGFDLASAPSGGTTRRADLDQVSINAISRIEVHHGPTPETPGSALAGAVNMVPRSAFERSRPFTSYSVHVMAKPTDRDFKKTAGPHWKHTQKIQPGFDFTHINPVSKTFGFTVGGGYSKQYTPQDSTVKGWRGVSLTTNGTYLPDTTADNPYMTDYQVRDSGKHTTRYSFNTSLDWRFARHDRLSFAFQHAFLREEYGSRYLNFYVGGVAPGGWSPTHTRGIPGRGEIRLQTTARDRPGATNMPTLTWRHDGPLYKGELGLGYSRSRRDYIDSDRGFFYSTIARRTGITVSFDDIDSRFPRTIGVADSKGVPIDPYKIDSYSLYSVATYPVYAHDTRRTVFGNLSRNLSVAGIPVGLKAGFDVRATDRDLFDRNPTFAWLGADGKQSSTLTATSDDVATFALDDEFSLHRPPWGFPKIQWVSNKKAWDAYAANPALVNWDKNTEYREAVGGSKRSEEIISSLFFRTDLSLLQNRLRIVTGVRAEQTNITGRGPLTDPTRNFQRDASGNLLLGPTDKPIAISSDPLTVSKLTYLERGAVTEKEYLRWFPSLNVSYNIRDNLIARLSTYTSVGRPGYNQYMGGLTLPDTTLGGSPDSNTISVNNPNIKPWDANTIKLRLEYYFERVGQFSVSVFRRDFKNFFGTRSFLPNAAFFANTGIDPVEYEGFYARTTYNLPGNVRMEGLDVDYKQALTFLPGWARGVQVFANASWQNASGSEVANFSGYIPRNINWGVSLTRPKYNVRVNWNHRGMNRGAVVTAARGVFDDTYNYNDARLYIDVTAEYFFHKKFGVFLNIRNVNEATQDVYIYNASTPDYARFRQSENYHALWTIGIKGSF